jgi:hypothetical protein
MLEHSLIIRALLVLPLLLRCFGGCCGGGFWRLLAAVSCLHCCGMLSCGDERCAAVSALAGMVHSFSSFVQFFLAPIISLLTTTCNDFGCGAQMP